MDVLVRRKQFYEVSMQSKVVDKRLDFLYPFFVMPPLRNIGQQILLP